MEPNYPEVRDFLEDIGLQALYREFVVDLGAMTVQDLYLVEETDLEKLGLKKLEIKRFLTAVAADDDDAVFEEIERELLEAGEQEVEDQPLQARRSDSPHSFSGSIHSVDEALFAEAREVAHRAEAKVDEAVIAAEERSAQLAADVAALNAEMEQMRTLSRKTLEEGVPPEPQLAAATPMRTPEEVLVAAQARAAAAKMEESIEEATRWSSRAAQHDSDDEMLEDEVASNMLADEVQEFVELVDRAATSPFPVPSSAKHQAVQRAAQAAYDAMVDLEQAATPVAPTTPSPRTRVRTLQSAEELEVELATKELLLATKDAEIKVMHDQLQEAQAMVANRPEPVPQLPLAPQANASDDLAVDEARSLNGSTADALRSDAALAAAEVEQWSHLAQRVSAKVMVMQTESASKLRKATEKSDAAATATGELHCWMELGRKVSLNAAAVLTEGDSAVASELAQWVQFASRVSTSGVSPAEHSAMKAAVDAALAKTDALIESNISLRQKLHMKASEQRQALQDAATSASLLAQSSAAIRSLSAAPEQTFKLDDALGSTRNINTRVNTTSILRVDPPTPAVGDPETVGADAAAYWKAKYEASQTDLEQACENVESLTARLESAIASTSAWANERARLEQDSLAFQQHIVELEQALDAERNDGAAAQLEIKRWMIAAAAAGADANDDLDSQNFRAAAALGSQICEAAAIQATETLSSMGFLRPQLSVTFVREGPLGMNLTSCRDGDGVMVLAVQSGTQAAEDHGTVLRTGLVISEVAGQPVHGLSYQEVTKAIAGHPGRPLTVNFWADGSDEDQQDVGHHVKYLNRPSEYE